MAQKETADDYPNIVARIDPAALAALAALPEHFGRAGT